jgi:hypothetical protein
MNPGRSLDLTAAAAVRGVIDREHDRRVVLEQEADDQVQHRQAHGVDRPHRTGEETIGAVMRP